MRNEVSAQRVTFGSCPTPKQVQQEDSLNSDTPPTNKRKHEDFEEDRSSQDVSKRRKLDQNEHGNYWIRSSRSLVVVLKCDSLSLLQSVSQNRGTMRTEKVGVSSIEAEISYAFDDMKRQKKKNRRLRRQWAKAMNRKPGRDPIGTPSFVGLKTIISTTPSTSLSTTAAVTNKNAEIKDSPKVSMKFGSKSSPNPTASTSSVDENNDRLIVKLPLPKGFFFETQ
ncbi:hypothetical protein EAE96_004418 [Botrytis aclada]|nr:hypothetical protein EAE96_004418 [Botrytis aclada]